MATKKENKAQEDQEIPGEFKLVAIRLLSKCNQKFRKVLSVNRPYVFYTRYDFSGYSDRKKVVGFAEGTMPDLYSFRNSENKVVKVNISALVGMNGSGKSSLVELWYAACYNLAILNDVLIDEDTGIRLTKKYLVPAINVEIFYQFDDKLVLLSLMGHRFQRYLADGMGKFVPADSTLLLREFFYTISINYSLHALNSRVLGDWVRLIFHKNDGYQTPIVLNPYRREGNIEINNEEYLVKSRLISNVLGKVSKTNKIEDSLRNILDRKIAHRLHVSLRQDKFKYDEEGQPVFGLTEKYGAMVFPQLFEHFFKNRDFKPEDTTLNRYAQEYILSKLENISKKYEPFKIFRSFLTSEEQTRGFMIMLSQEKSHVTFKLQQALNFLVNPLYFNRAQEFDLTVSYLSRMLLADKLLKDKELVDILPPSFFNVDIEFKDNGMFSELSSGEKQRIYSMATLIYHLKNLSSTNGVSVVYKYQHVNIVFDELELYFHPDLQRTLVHDLLGNIRKADLLSIRAINILFITHSPFILSDIPLDNILVLDKTGKPVTKGLDQTFGSNIFDLLKESFFLENGPMGEHARSVINGTIDWLNSTKREMELKEHHLSVINLIGEPVLQLKLLEMYDKVTGAKTKAEKLREKINELQSELNGLK